MSKPFLKLIWINEDLLAEHPNRGERRRQHQNDPPGPPAGPDNRPGLFARFRAWSNANAGFATMIGALIGAATAVLIVLVPFVIWFIFRAGQVSRDFNNIKIALYGPPGQAERGLVGRMETAGRIFSFLAAKGFLDGFYKDIAMKEKGFQQNAGILPVNLVYTDKPIENPPKTEVKSDSKDVIDYNVTYELIKLTATKMIFRVNGRIGNNKITDNIVTVPLKLNQPVEITDVYYTGGPRFFIEIIALPSQNFAIAALGPKESASS